MSDNLSHYVPKRLDDKGKFLFVDQDVALVAAGITMLGIWLGHPFLALVVGCFFAYKYNKLKAGGHPGLTVHLLYWFTGAPKLKDLPQSDLREFNG